MRGEARWSYGRFLFAVRGHAEVRALGQGLVGQMRGRVPPCRVRPMSSWRETFPPSCCALRGTRHVLLWHCVPSVTQKGAR